MQRKRNDVKKPSVVKTVIKRDVIQKILRQYRSKEPLLRRIFVGVDPSIKAAEAMLAKVKEGILTEEQKLELITCFRHVNTHSQNTVTEIYRNIVAVLSEKKSGQETISIDHLWRLFRAGALDTPADLRNLLSRDPIKIHWAVEKIWKDKKPNMKMQLRQLTGLDERNPADLDAQIQKVIFHTPTGKTIEVETARSAINAAKKEMPLWRRLFGQPTPSIIAAEKTLKEADNNILDEKEIAELAKHLPKVSDHFQTAINKPKEQEKLLGSEINDVKAIKTTIAKPDTTDTKKFGHQKSPEIRKEPQKKSSDTRGPSPSFTRREKTEDKERKDPSFGSRRNDP